MINLNKMTLDELRQMADHFSLLADLGLLAETSGLTPVISAVPGEAVIITLPSILARVPLHLTDVDMTRLAGLFGLSPSMGVAAGNEPAPPEMPAVYPEAQAASFAWPRATPDWLAEAQAASFASVPMASGEVAGCLPDSDGRDVAEVGEVQPAAVADPAPVAEAPVAEPVAEPDPAPVNISDRIAALDLPQDALQAHLSLYVATAGWSIAQDAELLHLSELGWPVHEIALQIQKPSDDVKKRFDLLTDKKGKKFKRDEVAARLVAMQAAIGG